MWSLRGVHQFCGRGLIGTWLVLLFFLTTACSYEIVPSKALLDSIRDKTPPNFSGSISQGSYVASLTQSPLMSWPNATDNVGIDRYQVQLGTAAGLGDILGWTDVGNVTSATIVNLSLTKGNTYYPSVRSLDAAGNISSAVLGPGWLATTLFSLANSLNQSGTVSTVTGESVQFTGQGGETPYTLMPSGLGYFNSVTGIYTAPLGIAPVTDTVTALDAVGQVTSTVIKIRAFESKDSFIFDDASALGNAAANALARDGSGNIYAVGMAADSISTQHWIVRKSSDGGATWSTVNDYILAAGKGASASAVGVDGSGNIYVAGYAIDSLSTQHWIVRKSSDGGATWSTVNDYILAAGKGASASAVGVDGSGNIYVGGNGSDAGNVAHWIVRKSGDGGASRTTEDDYYLVAGKPASPSGLAVDSVGNIYITGTAKVSSLGSEHWIVRKSGDGGVTWSTVSNFNTNAGGSRAHGRSICVDNLGVIYAGGDAIDISGFWHWIVRKSGDGGSSWNTVDDYNLTTTGGVSYSLAADSMGNIFSAGQSIDAGNENHWIVRKSSNGGVSWSTVDDYIMGSMGNGLPSAMVVDGSWGVYVSGKASGASGQSHWIVRKSANSGVLWATVSDYNLSVGFTSLCRAIGSDGAGNIYAAGTAIDSINSSNHWIVRKSSDGGASWSTVDIYNYLGGGGGAADANALLVDKLGNIYVGGSVEDSYPTHHWIIRKSSDQGASWTTISDYNSGATDAYLLSLAVDNLGNIYAAGNVVDNGGVVNHWIVTKSGDAGATWSTVSDYNLVAGNFSQANALGTDSLGNIYVAGYGDNASALWTWVVRKSADGGSTWSTVDTFNPFAGGWSLSTSLTVDGAGNIYAAGLAATSTGVNHWIVRKSSDAGVTWNTVSDFNLYAGISSTANAMTVDSAGKIYAAGSGFDTTGLLHWVVRRSGDGGNTWATIEDRSGISTGSTSANGIVPCLNQQVCVGGQMLDELTRAAKFHVRILSQ